MLRNKLCNMNIAIFIIQYFISSVESLYNIVHGWIYKALSPWHVLSIFFVRTIL